MKGILKHIVVYILTVEARLVLKKYRPRIVAITGNVGKTSTKDAIYAVLSHAYYVRKTQKSLNSDLGVPLTILGCESGWNNPFAWMSIMFEGLLLIVLKNHYPKWLVLEVGAGRPGEIRDTASWLAPDIVVVTPIGDVPVHVEMFGSVDDIVREKGYLVEALREDGVLFVNHDSPRALSLREKTHAAVKTYGFSSSASLFASHQEIVYAPDTEEPAGVRFRLNYSGGSMPVVLMGTAGFEHIYTLLAAFSVGIAEGVNLIAATQWVLEYDTPPGRMKIIPGLHRSIIYDDSYNAAPAAVHAALDTLVRTEARGKKIAILGDMLELGSFSKDAHKDVGSHVARGVDLLVTVGVRAQDIGQAAQEAGMPKARIVHMANSVDAGKHVARVVHKGDVVLVKGSQSMRMERAVRELMAHPEDARKLLVRQEKEWLKRK